MKVMLDPGSYMPKRAHDSDAGFDLRSPVEIIIEPALSGGRTATSSSGRIGCCAAIDTGVHMQIPQGYFGKVETKSGLNMNHNIVCCGGVIDEGYTGPIVVMLYNFSDKPYVIKRGDKIAQLVIQPYLAPGLELVYELDETDRGDKGFGSTGR